MNRAGASPSTSDDSALLCVTPAAKETTAISSVGLNLGVRRNMYWQDAKNTLLRPLADAPRAGLVTDMDGTISPVAETPEGAQVTPHNLDHLRRLSQMLPLVAVISGRRVDDVRAKINLPDVIYVGNHGLERQVDGRTQYAPDVTTHRPALAAAAEAARVVLMPGAWLEDKYASLAVHYRMTADPQAAAVILEPALRSIAHQHKLRLFQGRMVFELRPPLDVHKGSAFRDLIEAHRLEAAVFLGDDTTDADALRMAKTLRQRGVCHAVGLGVESPDMPPAVAESADLMVQGVVGVESFLAWLLNARSAPNAFRASSS